METESDIFDVLRKETTIYHYTSALTALEHILPYARLRFSPLALTNDPYEYKELIPFGGSTNLSLEDEHMGFSAMYGIARLRKEKHHVLAFSLNQSNDISYHRFPVIERYEKLGCCKLRMWSQYGDNYRGVSIALDRNKLLDKLTKLESVKRVYSDVITYKPIRELNLPSVNFNKVISSGVDAYCEEFINQNADSLFFCKDPSFEDEKEFRIIIYSDSDERLYIDIKDSLIAVVIGDRFPDGLLPSMLYLCKKLKVPCRRAFWESDRLMLYNPNPLDHKLKEVWDDLK